MGVVKYRCSSYKEILEACLITLGVNIPWHILGIWQEVLDLTSINPDRTIAIFKIDHY